MTLTFADWMAIASIALPLLVKVCSDWIANSSTVHNQALARIVGMAQRGAATIATTLAALPPGANAAEVQRMMIETTVKSLISEMGDSISVTGASADRLTGIVQGELDKLRLSSKPAVGDITVPLPVPVEIVGAS